MLPVGGPGDFFEEHLCGAGRAAAGQGRGPKSAALSSMLAAGEDDEEEETWGGTATTTISWSTAAKMKRRTTALGRPLCYDTSGPQVVFVVVIKIPLHLFPKFEKFELHFCTRILSYI